MNFFKQITVVIILLIVFLAGCQKQVEKKEEIVDFGKTVVFDYAAGFDNGTLFDTTFESAAREAGIYSPNRAYTAHTVVIGKDPLIPGLVEAMLGMKEGGVKNIRIPPAKAYGEKIENSAFDIKKSAIEKEVGLGELIVITVADTGENIPVFVKKINEDNVTVDLNHPLAGEFIQFAIIVRNIE